MKTKKISAKTKDEEIIKFLQEYETIEDIQNIRIRRETSKLKFVGFLCSKSHLFIQDFNMFSTASYPNEFGITDVHILLK